MKDRDFVLRATRNKMSERRGRIFTMSVIKVEKEMIRVMSVRIVYDWIVRVRRKWEKEKKEITVLLASYYIKVTEREKLERTLTPPPISLFTKITDKWLNLKSCMDQKNLTKL